MSVLMTPQNVFIRIYGNPEPYALDISPEKCSQRENIKCTNNIVPYELESFHPNPQEYLNLNEWYPATIQYDKFGLRFVNINSGVKFVRLF